MKLPVKYDELDAPRRRAVREEYVKLQRGDCHHCNEPLTGKAADFVTRKRVNRRLFPDTFFKHPVHLHHCHKTGLTIGAVHNYCNAVLWQYHGQ